MALAKENKYKGTIKRSVWLSEAGGVNSPTYSDQDLLTQAAGVAYAWKKINGLPGIDGIQWHNWFDHPDEGGARLGLRKFPQTDNAETKLHGLCSKKQARKKRTVIFSNSFL